MNIKNLALAVRFLLEIYGSIAIVISIIKFDKLGVYRYILAALAVTLIVVLWMLFISPKASIQVSPLIAFSIEITIISFAIILQYLSGQERASLIYFLLYTISKIILTIG